MWRKKGVLLIILFILGACMGHGDPVRPSETIPVTDYSIINDETEQAHQKPTEILNIYPIGDISLPEYLASLNHAPMRRGVMVEVGINANEFRIVRLDINNQEVSNQLLEIADGLMPGPWYISWGPDLGEGEYSARFYAITKNEKEIEYIWDFTILAP